MTSTLLSDTIEATQARELTSSAPCFRPLPKTDQLPDSLALYWERLLTALCKYNRTFLLRPEDVTRFFQSNSKELPMLPRNTASVFSALREPSDGSLAFGRRVLLEYGTTLADPWVPLALEGDDHPGDAAQKPGVFIRGVDAMKGWLTSSLMGSRELPACDVSSSDTFAVRAVLDDLAAILESDLACVPEDRESITEGGNTASASLCEWWRREITPGVWEGVIRSSRSEGATGHEVFLLDPSDLRAFLSAQLERCNDESKPRAPVRVSPAHIDTFAAFLSSERNATAYRLLISSSVEETPGGESADGDPAGSSLRVLVISLSPAQLKQRGEGLALTENDKSELLERKIEKSLRDRESMLINKWKEASYKAKQLVQINKQFALAELKRRKIIADHISQLQTQRLTVAQCVLQRHAASDLCRVAAVLDSSTSAARRAVKLNRIEDLAENMASLQEDLAEVDAVFASTVSAQLTAQGVDEDSLAEELAKLELSVQQETTTATPGGSGLHGDRASSAAETLPQSAESEKIPSPATPVAQKAESDRLPIAE